MRRKLMVAAAVVGVVLGVVGNGAPRAHALPDPLPDVDWPRFYCTHASPPRGYPTYVYAGSIVLREYKQLGYDCERFRGSLGGG